MATNQNLNSDEENVKKAAEVTKAFVEKHFG